MKLDEIPDSAGFVVMCLGGAEPHQAEFIPMWVGGTGNDAEEDPAVGHSKHELRCPACGWTERLNGPQSVQLLRWATEARSMIQTGRLPDGSMGRRFVAPLRRIQQLLYEDTLYE